MGLSGGTSGIEVFTTLDKSKQVAGYPPGTTKNYLENQASAYLNLPPGATVEYAILTWGGTIGTNTIVNGKCEFTTPASTIPNIINANPAFYGAPGSIFLGSNSADVTSLVSAAGSGLYIVSKAFATLGGTDGSLGWMLNVVVTNPSYTRKMIDINVGVIEVPMGTSQTTSITGLVTPRTGKVTGRYLTMGYDGENNNTASINGGLGILPLTGPNNTRTGFLNHQINNCDTLSPNVGQLDTTGSFGTFNSTGNVQGTRYGTDVTNVSLNGKIANGTTIVNLINTGSGEGIAYVVNAFQIDNQGFDDPIKTVDKNYANIGDTITYNIAIINTGTLPYTNVILKDTIPTGTSFIANSVTIDGVSNPGNPSPPTGVSVGTIPVSKTTTISFKVLVSSTIPTPNPIKNNATATFDYSGFTQGINSNTVGTTISAAILYSSKISKAYANINDVITYTIPIKNTGSTSATKIRFIDTIPNGTSFVANSLKQDSTVLTGLSPNPPGATLPNAIGGGKTSTVTFQVRVITLPSPNPIPNYASMVFQYTIDNSTVPNVTGSGSSNTNLATTFINRADLSITKIVDKNYATLNDVLTYTITIPNTGTTTAYSVIFKDTIPTGTTFVTNSFTLNGVVLTGKTPASPGINIGTIPVGGLFTVSFKVTVNTIPSPNRVNNAATTTFNYQVDPSITTRTVGSSNSNIATTTITRTAIINPTKSVNVSGAFIGDTVTYTVILKNTGTTTASNVFFSDTMPNGTSFVTNSVKVNGVTISGGTLTPPPGVSIPNLGINKTATLTFNVTVDTTPSPNPTLNIGTASYSYTDTASGTSGTGSNDTNVVPLQVYPENNPFKVVDNLYAQVGDTLTYTLGWRNALGVQQTNVVFVDTIPAGTTFVPNSVTVRGVSKVGATVTGPNGINTLTLAAGQMVTVTFKVVINTIPTINPIPNDTTVIYSSTLSAGRQSDVSNIATTQVNYSNLSGGAKLVDKNFATVGDMLTYTITVVNSGISPAENVVFYDTIPTGTSFIDGSVVVNGVTIPGENPDPSLGGVNIGTIAAGAVSTVVFKVNVDMIPSPNSIPNTATYTGSYVVDPILQTTISIGTNTNTVLTKVYFADLINPLKGVNKLFTDIPTTLTYTITITNTGNTTANHVVFVDTVPVGTDFVPNSFTVNGLPISSVTPNPPGVNIGTIPAGKTFTVTFKVTTNSIPTTNPIPNTGTVGYDFIVDPTLLTTANGTHDTNTVDTQVNHANLSNITKFTDTQYGQCGDIITYTISIPNTGSADAFNVVLNDTVPNGTIYVPNSLQVDGNPIGGTPDSILVGTVPAGGTSVVTFQVQINC